MYGESLWNSGEKIIDRDRFADALEAAFNRYLDDLEKSPMKSEVWRKAKRRIWWLIAISR